MGEVAQDELKQAVEHMHNCKAALVQSVPVHETFGSETVWDGMVHVFSIKGNPAAARAYAWSSPVEGNDRRRFFAVLHIPPVTSPIDAVRAAIVAESREKEPNRK